MLERIRTFVAKLDMSQIRAFWYFFLRRYDADKWDLTQTLRRYLLKKMVSGASAYRPQLNIGTYMNRQ